MFANQNNRQNVPAFCSIQEDAFQQDWNAYTEIWANPPFSQKYYEGILNKLKSCNDKTAITVVVPVWAQHSWYKELERFQIAPSTPLRHTEDLFSERPHRPRRAQRRQARMRLLISSLAVLALAAIVVFLIIRMFNHL